MTRRAVLFVLLACAAYGCAPAIGDDCDISTDCSVTGDRICDIAQPGGYCTVFNCDQNSCPDDSVCVEYSYDPARLAQTWCMAPCEDNGDCRGGRYKCTKASAIIDNDGRSIARVLDSGGDKKKFCAVTEP
ncbi:MAG: hypothetical protein R3A78_00935 [Polyangiales bacterium]